MQQLQLTKTNAVDWQNTKQENMGTVTEIKGSNRAVLICYYFHCIGLILGYKNISKCIVSHFWHKSLHKSAVLSLPQLFLGQNPAPEKTLVSYRRGRLFWFTSNPRATHQSRQALCTWRPHQDRKCFYRISFSVIVLP